jgi:voltage-gated potassium channel Kch
MATPDQSRFSLALTQGSEFGFVLIAVAVGYGLLKGRLPEVLTAIIALSMALAPLLMMFDEKVIQTRFADGDILRDPDTISHEGVDVIIAGHGRFGMMIGRVLHAQGKRAVMLDIDSTQVDALRKFGFKVFYGDALRIDLLEAAGAREAKVLVIAMDDREKVTELVKLAQRNFPDLKLVVRVYDRSHAHDVLREGVDLVHREVFGSSMDAAGQVLVQLGKSPEEAERDIRLFRNLDEKFLRQAVRHKDDQQALISLAKKSRAEIARVFAADRESRGTAGDGD